MTEKERRKSPRRPVLETFSFFIVIPKKGMHRLPVYDVSDFGIRFDFDAEGENDPHSSIQNGDQFEIQFYLNQALYLPLSIQVARVDRKNDVRQVGAQFTNTKSKPHQAFIKFITMLDELLEVAKTTNQ